MADYTTPSALSDYQSSIEALARQRKLAEALRAQSIDSAPQGQMVSGRYVAPSFLNFLVNPMKGYQAGRMDTESDSTERGINRDIEQAQQRWQSSMPSSVTSTTNLPGPPDPDNPNALNVTQTKPPTLRQAMEHYLKGEMIPRNKDAAGNYLKYATSEIEREDKQAEAERTHQLNQALLRYKAQEDLRLRGERQDDIRKQDLRHDATLRAIAAGHDASRVQAAGAKGGQKPIPRLITDKLSIQREKADSIGAASESFQDSFGGIQGTGMTWLSDNLPIDTDAGRWWRDYRKDNQLIERYNVFGGTLTKYERDSYKSADIHPFMHPDMIKSHLERRAILSKLAYYKNIQLQERNKYNAHEVLGEDPEAVQAEITRLEGLFAENMKKAPKGREASGEVTGAPATSAPVTTSPTGPASTGVSPQRQRELDKQYGPR